MATIERSSARIVEIIDVIDGIAFQTNILALNAAVEAARAGGMVHEIVGGIEQTHQAITEMDQITQHNAALVEDVAATAATLKEQRGGSVKMAG